MNHIIIALFVRFVTIISALLLKVSRVQILSHKLFIYYPPPVQRKTITLVAREVGSTGWFNTDPGSPNRAFSLSSYQ
jgi:hypothetical protein